MYKIPNPEEFREFLKKRGLTGSQAARLVGKDSRAIRRYTAPENQKGARSMQWDTWALLRILSGAASVEDILGEISRVSVEIETKDGKMKPHEFSSEEEFRAYLKAHDWEIVGFMELPQGQQDSPPATPV